MFTCLRESISTQTTRVGRVGTETEVERDFCKNMENATGTNESPCKCICFDNSTMPAIDLTKSDASSLPPKDLALSFMCTHTASLQPSITTILEKLSAHHIDLHGLLFSKKFHLKRMQDDPDFVP